jgi:hypothetical protein
MGTITRSFANLITASGPSGLPAGLGQIEEFDMWRITTDMSVTSGAVRYGITSNWERADTGSFSLTGTGMTESSGVFSFTSTGKYYVEFNAMGYIGSSTVRAFNVDLIYTPDNSNYETVCNQEFNLFNSGSNTHGSAIARYVFNITDLANQKLKFGVWGQAGEAATIQGSTSTNFTFVTFIKFR